MTDLMTTDFDVCDLGIVAIVDDVLANYTAVRISTADDNDAILTFFGQQSLRTTGDEGHVTYDRSPDYFALDQYRYNFNLTILSTDISDQITGVASISVGTALINGRVQPAIYLADLRVGQYNRVFLKLTQIYAAIIDRIYQKCSARSSELTPYFFTTIMDSNALSLRFLLSKKRPFNYCQRRRFNMVNILGAVGRAESEKHMGLTPHVFEFRLRHWPGLSYDAFYVMTNAEGNISACCAPLSLYAAKRTRVDQVPFVARIANMGLRFLPGLSGLAPVSPNRDIDILYLTHLCGASPAATASLIRSIVPLLIQRHKEANLIAFPEYPGYELPGLRHCLVSHRISMSLFQVTPKDGRGEISTSCQPSFEMCMA